MFGFRKPIKQKKYTILIWTSMLFFGMMYFTFWFVNDLVHFKNKWVWDQLSLGKKVSRVINGDLSRFFSSVDNVWKNYASWGYLTERKEDIDSIMEFLSTNKSLIERLPENYRPFAFFISSLAWYRDQIYDILGFGEKKIYMMVLENSSEARPNGGFFWSYAIVQLYNWKIEDYKIFDAYYPQYINSGAKVSIVKPYADIFGNEGIGFISSNIYGFTDLDGWNIKLLYEKTFPWQKLDGVIFLKSSLVEKILPGIKDRLITRQFLNANIDKIETSEPLNKKELYIKELQSYIQKNLNQIILYIAQNFDLVAQDNNINFYLPKITKEFRGFLSDHGLINIFDPNKIYIWDFNLAYNKIDRFVTKRRILQDDKGRLITDGNGDIINQHLDKWVYDLYIFYNINIPDTYIQQIQNLVSYYGINLAPREMHILWLSYNRTNRVIIWMWKHITPLTVEWWVSATTGTNDFGIEKSWFGARDIQEADLWYANIITFKLSSVGNNIFKVVKVRLIVNQ